MSEREPQSTNQAPKLREKLTDNNVVITAILIATLQAAGLALRTSNNETVQKVVAAADCYDLYMGALHPLNNCSGQNPLVDGLREIRN